MIKFAYTVLLSPGLDSPYILTEIFLSEVTNMDLFWSGLARRASEHTWNERKSQFSKVFETVVGDIKMKKISENHL